jgi:hypothetical protein
MNSYQSKNKLKGILESTAQNIDEIYFLLKEELESETLQRKEKIEKTDEETSRVFNMLNAENCVKLIKHKLPFRVKLINKIIWAGHGTYGSGKIKISFNFNNSHEIFDYEFYISEIKEILKIKE